jgi:hypothetical protein
MNKSKRSGAEKLKKDDKMRRDLSRRLRRGHSEVRSSFPAK